MFGRNPDNNDAPMPPQGPPSGPMPMPTIRVFEVVRVDGFNNEETITVHAHALAVADGNRTVFQTWRIDPVIGPQLQVSRVLTAVIDVEDVTPAPVVDEPSRIIH